MAKDSFDRLLERLQDSEGFNFDGGNYEDESFEVENLRKIAASPTARPEVRAAASARLVRMSATPIRSGANNLGNAVAAFGVTITRNTRTIPQTLPIPLFCGSLLEGGYREVMLSKLPGAVQLTSVQFGTNVSTALSQIVRFTFTEGANVDTVDVSCNTSSYTAFLRALANNTFEMGNTRITVSNVAEAPNQFAQTATLFTKTLFGSYNESVMPLPTSFSPNQFQAGILDLNVPIRASHESGLFIPIIRPAADNYSVTLSGFVSAFSRD